jgi:hypothetical protein
MVGTLHPNIVRVIKSRRMRWAGHVASMGRGEVCTGFWWGKRPLGRPRRRWEDVIEKALKGLDGGHDWIDLAQNRDRWQALVNAVMNLEVT